jgi:hypothetical protein
MALTSEQESRLPSLVLEFLRSDQQKAAVRVAQMLNLMDDAAKEQVYSIVKGIRKQQLAEALTALQSQLVTISDEDAKLT